MTKPLTVDECIKQSHDEMVSNIKYRVRLQKSQVEKIRNTFEFLDAAQAVGLPVVYPKSAYGAISPDIEITNADHLPLLRRVVGQIKDSEHYEPLHPDDARKTDIKQFLSVENEKFQHIKFWQKKKVAKKGGKCKIRRVNQSYLTVVCTPDSE